MTMSNEEETMLRDSVRAWADREASVRVFRTLRDHGTAHADASAWTSIASMGWAGIAVPGEFGGTALDFHAAGMVVTELARTLVASPLSASLVASAAIVRNGSLQQKRRWLPAITNGQMIAALAYDEGPHHDATKVVTKAVSIENGWRLTGTKAFVPEGDSADLFVVATQDALFVVPGDLEGVVRQHRQMVDSRSHADLHLDVTLPNDSRLEGSDIEMVLDLARALAAAEMLGLSEAAFALTLDYLKNRVQFDRPIGSFQALQHRATILFTRLALMRSAVEGALAALDANEANAALTVSMAKALVGEGTNLILREAVQMHGGIGMTDEHDIGLYLKRGKVLETMWGTSSYHRGRYAKALGF